MRFICWLLALLTIPVALAQIEFEEVAQLLLKALFGRVPDPCLVTLANPECVHCIAFVKVLPLMFYTAIFFLIFYAVISQIVPTRTPETLAEAIAAGAQRPRAYTKIAALLAISLGLFFLHAQITPKLTLWVQILLFIAALVIARGAWGLGAQWMIVAAIALWIIFWIVLGAVSPVVEEMEALCMP